MARINLLPWRDERREELKREFLLVIVILVAVAAVSVLFTGMLFDNKVDVQKGRNSYIEKHIAELDEQVKEIRDLQKQRTQLLDRMTVIQELQGNRPIIVRNS